MGGAGDSYGYLSFTYDNGYTQDRGRELVVRAVELLDYTPGGPDLAASAINSDVRGDDEVHGETGDDTIYLGAGNDVAFGDSGDDDIIGGWGHDWVSGGTGTDGILGDDGRIRTRRNSTSYGRGAPWSTWLPVGNVAAGKTTRRITTPGQIQSRPSTWTVLWQR